MFPGNIPEIDHQLVIGSEGSPIFSGEPAGLFNQDEAAAAAQSLINGRHHALVARAGDHLEGSSWT